MTKYLFHEHTREEIAEFANQRHPVVIPLGATEQHGPHLPVYTDTIICEHIVTQAVASASKTHPIWMTPILSIGCSDHHKEFNGTISFSSATYLQMLHDITESLVACGFKKIIFINGHGGNDKIMHQAVQDLAVKHPIWVGSASYWAIAATALREVNAKEVGMVPGHAGGFETSLIMALQPDLVHTEHIRTTHIQRPWMGTGVPGTFVGRHKELTGYDGYTDAAHLATAEKGNLYLQAIISSLTDWLIKTMNTLENGEKEI